MMNTTEYLLNLTSSEVNATMPTTTIRTTTRMMMTTTTTTRAPRVQSGPLCVPGEEYVPISYPPELLRQFDSWMPVRDITRLDIALKILFYVLIMLVDTMGNGLVIFLVAVNKKMRTPTNALLVNLALADLLLCLLCMWVHLGKSINQDWPFGLGICKVNMFAQVTVITSSVLTLTMISVERFFAIVFPLRRGWTLRLTIVLISIIWVIACSIASPQLHVRYLQDFEFRDRHVIICTEKWAQVYLNPNCDRWKPDKVLYHLFVGVVMFLVPIFIMIVSYSVICVCLLVRKAPGSSSSGQSSAKRRVVRMLMVVLVVFVVCWAPIHVLEVIPLFDKDFEIPEAGTYAALFIGYTNSALNPVLYAGFNENFRRGFKEIFKCGCLPSNRGDRVQAEDSRPTCNRVGSGAVTTVVASTHHRPQLRPTNNGVSDKHLLQVHTVSTSLATTSFNGT